MGVPRDPVVRSGLVWLGQFAKKDGEKAGVPAATRRRHVPGAEALVDSESMMPGLKSRPISETSFPQPVTSGSIWEASFSSACTAIWSPRKIAPTIFPLVKLYAFGMGGYANYFQVSGCLFSWD